MTWRRTRPPAPMSVSAEARAYLDAPSSLSGDPDLADVDAWRRLAADPVRWREHAQRADEGARAGIASLLPSSEELRRGWTEIAGVRTAVLRPARIVDEDSAPAFLDLHGGGLVHGGGDLAWMRSAVAASDRPGPTLTPDYRMPPAHPFPAALDDCVAVYREMLVERPPERIVVSGLSAGGNLAAALLLRAKEENLPMPAALVLLSPEVDLTESGDSFRTNLGIDPMGPLMGLNRLYAGDQDLDHPLLSPLFGDVSGFPPTLLQSGTRDLFLSNTVRMHRHLLAAGVRAELHVFEAMPHGRFGGLAPEDRDLRRQVRSFELAHLSLV